MSRLTLIIVIVLLVPVILIGGAMFLLANPDYYRDSLTKAALDQTGFEIAITGDIKWRYLPPIALAISGVDVRPPGATEPLAQVKDAAIDLALWPLLFGGEISIKGLSLDGVLVNAIIDSDGKANWEVAETTPPAAPGDEPATDTELDLNIDEIEITDMKINYIDEPASARYEINVSSLQTGAVAPDAPIALQTALVVTDNAGMKVDMTAEGGIAFNAALTRLTMTDLKVNQTIGLPDMAPIRLELTLSGEYDLDASQLDVALAGTFDKSKVNGTLGANLADTISATFDLTLDRLDVNDYVAATADAPEATAVAPTDTEVLPLELLDAYKLKGVVRIGEVLFEPWQFTDFSADIDNADRKLVANMNMKGYDGTMNMVFTGSTAAGGAGQTRVEVAGMDIAKVTELESITGLVSFQSDTTFKGSMLSNILASLDGITNFNVANGTLDVTPLKQAAAVVDALRGKDSGISAWPDRMPFQNLAGEHRFNKGVAANQQFAFKMESLNVTGSGGLDYFGNTIGYDINMNLDETSTGQFKVPPELARITWPLRCAGAMDATVVQLCLPDRDAIQTIVADVLKQEVQRQGEDKIKQAIEEKVPEDLRDKARDLLKGLRRP